MSPASASASPRHSLSVAVLPAPLGPSSPKHSPLATSRSTPQTTSLSPNDLRSPRTARTLLIAPSFRSLPIRLDEIAQHMQLAMEEMIGARYQRHRQVLRPRPVEHRGERNCDIELAMDDERAGGHGRQLTVDDRDPNQHDSFRSDSLGKLGLHRRAERETGEHHRFRGNSFVNRKQILYFPVALVMRALALADAAEVGPPRLVAEVDKRSRESLRHLVVERAAKQRVRVGNECGAARRAFWRVHRALYASCGPRDEFAAGARPHMRSRSTMRPCCRCSSMISSMSARSTYVYQTASG